MVTPPSADLAQYRVTFFFGPEPVENQPDHVRCVFNVKKRSWKGGGACVIELGAHTTAVMSNDDDLAAELEEAGRRAEDRAWHMPMAEEYHEQLKSNFADFTNSCGREGGAITAAFFLGKFTEGLRWAHLDIAGTAYLSGAQKGSTGRPVPLLVDFLLHRRTP